MRRKREHLGKRNEIDPKYLRISIRRIAFTHFFLTWPRLVVGLMIAAEHFIAGCWEKTKPIQSPGMPSMKNGNDDPPKGKRGFASMDPEKRRAIASKGGSSVPSEKRAFSIDRELAAVAGRKGGSALNNEDRGFSKDRALASEAGRKGAVARRNKSPD